MSIREIIGEAIKSRMPINFEYPREGKILGKRIGNPHALYYDERGQIKIDVYQIEGVSDTPQEPLPKWRRFFVEYISSLEILHGREPFILAEGYNPESILYRNPIVLA